MDKANRMALGFVALGLILGGLLLIKECSGAVLRSCSQTNPTTSVTDNSLDNKTIVRVALEDVMKYNEQAANVNKTRYETTKEIREKFVKILPDFKEIQE